MKYICTLIALFLTVGTLSAQETTLSLSSDSLAQARTQAQAEAPKNTFGYFSYDQVMKSMPEYAIAQKSIEDMKAMYDKELETAEKDFSRKYAEFLEGQKTFPENIMLKRQKELQQLMNQSIQFKNEAKELLAAKAKELMEPIKTRLDAAIQSVGYENRFLYILNTDSNAYPYISSDAVDCTSQILKKLAVE